MNRIYYFSSTGNTLAAAREFAEKLGDTELLSIADLDRAEEVDLSGADTVGIFFPVYCFGLPGIVQKFISRIEKGSGGSLEVNSVPGEGTKAIARFPKGGKTS